MRDRLEVNTAKRTRSNVLAKQRYSRWSWLSLGARPHLSPLTLPSHGLYAATH